MYTLLASITSNVNPLPPRTFQDPITPPPSPQRGQLSRYSLLHQLACLAEIPLAWQRRFFWMDLSLSFSASCGAMSQHRWERGEEISINREPLFRRSPRRIHSPSSLDCPRTSTCHHRNGVETIGVNSTKVRHPKTEIGTGGICLISRSFSECCR